MDIATADANLKAAQAAEAANATEMAKVQSSRPGVLATLDAAERDFDAVVAEIKSGDPLWGAHAPTPVVVAPPATAADAPEAAPLPPANPAPERLMLDQSVAAATDQPSPDVQV